MTVKTKRKNEDNQNQMYIIGGIIVIAVLAILAIVISANGVQVGPSIDYSEIPQERTADGGFILGDPSAPITIVAFEDFLCPSCQSYQGVIKSFINEFVVTGLARFEYRILPTQGFSDEAAAFAECADELYPGTFWDAHDEMFRLASAERFDPNTTPRRFADNMGMSYTDLLACSADADQWQIDQQLGTQYQVTGTPTVLVRYGNGPLQPSPVGPRPTIDGLRSLVTSSQ